MKKLTIVTDSNGTLIGAVNGHSLTFKHEGMESQVSFQPGHKLHKVEVDDDMDMAAVSDVSDFQSRLVNYMPKS